MNFEQLIGFACCVTVPLGGLVWFLFARIRSKEITQKYSELSNELTDVRAQTHSLETRVKELQIALGAVQAIVRGATLSPVEDQARRTPDELVPSAEPPANSLGERYAQEQQAAPFVATHHEAPVPAEPISEPQSELLVATVAANPVSTPSAIDTAPFAVPPTAPADTSIPQRPEFGAPPKDEDPGLEVWLGVRGAAALGAMVLVVAAVFLFKYGAENGWFPPAFRVIVATLVGVGCVAGSEVFRKRISSTLADWGAGAGISILYAATWAARSLYHLIDGTVAYPAMVVFTATCGVLAIVRNAPAIAGLGLAGGFATPLLLSTGEHHPIALFSYLLLLDVGIVLVARKKNWPLLAVVSYALTALFYFAWIGFRLQPGEVGLATIVALCFGLAFLVAAPDWNRPANAQVADADEDPWWRWLPALGLALPAIASLVLAAQAHRMQEVAPLGVLIVAIVACAEIVGAMRGDRAFGPVAVMSSTLTLITYANHRTDSPAEIIELVAFTIAIAIVSHVGLEIGRRKLLRAAELTGAAPLRLSRSFGTGMYGALAVITLGSAVSQSPHIAWTIAFGIVGAIAMRSIWVHGRLSSTAQTPFNIILGVLLSMVLLARVIGTSGPGSHRLVIVTSVVGSAAFAVLAYFAWVSRRRDAAAAVEGHAPYSTPVAWTAVTMVTMLAPMLSTSSMLGGPLFVPTRSFDSTLLALAPTIVALFIGLSASALHGRASSLTVIALAAGWSSLSIAFLFNSKGSNAGLVVALLAITATAFSVWPTLLRRAYVSPSAAHRASALGYAFIATCALLVYHRGFGRGGIGLIAAGFGVIELLHILYLTRTNAVREERIARVVPHIIVGTFFAVAAIPLELRREWLSIGWAIEGAALLWIYRRVDHPALKYLGATLLSVVAVRLLLNPYVLHYHPRGPIIVNWLAYTYLVPAAAMMAGSVWLSNIERERLRDGEQRVFGSWSSPLGALLASASLLVTFAWINLTIFDAFSSGREIEVSFDRHSSRDLALSIAWAVYALVLLGIGMARRVAALRWVSLALILITVSKVFLYDLAALRGLYRVGSLTGLAISLIAISLLYQRFVFAVANKPEARALDGGAAADSDVGGTK